MKRSKFYRIYRRLESWNFILDSTGNHLIFNVEEKRPDERTERHEEKLFSKVENQLEMILKRNVDVSKVSSHVPSNTFL